MQTVSPMVGQTKRIFCALLHDRARSKTPPAAHAMSEVFFEARLRRAPVARDFGLTILACEEGWHTITQVEPGGEGEQSGLAVGDRICEVGGKPLPRKLHSIVTYLPSRDSEEYVNLGVRRGPAKLTNEPAATAPESPSKPGVSLEAAKRGASNAKTKPSSLGAAAEAKAAAEADAAAAAAKAARGEPEPEPESPLGDRIAVHTSEGVVRTKPGGGAPASASAGTAKREATEAKGRESSAGNAPSQAKAAGAPAAGGDFKKVEKKLSETLAKGLKLPKGAAGLLCGVCTAPRKKSTGEPVRVASPNVEGA